MSLTKTVIMALTAISLTACCDCPEYNSPWDSGADGQVRKDAATQEDAAVQEDADTQEDAAIQNDAATQNDAEVIPPAEVTYETDMKINAVWNGYPTIVSEVEVVSTNMDATLNEITWTLMGTAPDTSVADATLLVNGSPITQSATWISTTELQFTTSLPLPQSTPITIELRIRTMGGLCDDITFDIAAGSDIKATGANQSTAVVQEGPNSVTPVPLPIEGFELILSASTPSGSIFPPTTGTLIIFEIISSFDAEIRRSPMEVMVNPFSELTYFADFHLEGPMGPIWSAAVPVPCTGNTCGLDFRPDIPLAGNCQQNDPLLVNVMAQHPSQDTFLQININMADWEVVNTISAAIIPPEYLNFSISGNPILAVH